MKKIILTFFILLILSSFFYCIFDKKDNDSNSIIDNKNEDVRGVFVSFIELSKLKNMDINGKKNYIKEMIGVVYDFKLNTIILQVRPFCDAIYKSNIFYRSSVVYNDKIDLDILEYFINEAHKKNIKIYAWINPYRVRSNNDLSSISGDDNISKFINTNKMEVKNGIYLNPADSSVLELIINGVKEIVSNYRVDGILYDDYFYPSNTIDIENYNKEGNGLTLFEYRINNINKLIKSTYDAIKSINKDVLFIISPQGNINNNLNNEYLDIEFILKNNNYIDIVMPQLYYGFLNSTMPFIDTLNVWNNIILNNDTKLVIALALYKSGKEDKYAKDGYYEWINNSDIIRNEIKESMKVSKYNGFSLFRYDFLVSNDNKCLEEEVKGLRIFLEEN